MGAASRCKQHLARSGGPIPHMLWGCTVLVLWIPSSAASQVVHLERRVLQIGTLDGPGAVFGEVTDAASIRAGPIVLDGRLNTLQLFDHNGRLSSTIARPGTGPGELARPVAVTANRDAVYVLDPGAGRVAVFAVKNDSVLYDRQLGIDFTGFDLCIVGDTILVLGTREGATIHAISVSGAGQRSFGLPWGPGHPLLDRSLSRGYLACAPANPIVVAVSSIVPEVRAYRLNGDLEWTRRLPQFEVVDFRMNRDGSVTYRPGKAGYYDVVVGATAIDRHHFLIQYGSIREGASGHLDITDRRSIVFDSQGRAGPIQREVPRLLSVDQSIALAASEDPFPKLSGFQFSVRMQGRQ